MINGYDIDSVKYYVFRVVFRPDSFDCCSVFQSKSFENWNKPMERYLDKQPIFVTFRNILLWLWLWLLGTLRSKALIQMCIFFSCAKHCNSVFDCYFHSNCKKKKTHREAQERKEFHEFLSDYKTRPCRLAKKNTSKPQACVYVEE